MKKRTGHSGPRTLAKCRIRGMSVRTGRVSTITATFLVIGNRSLVVGLDEGLDGVIRLERERWLPVSSVVRHQYVLAVIMKMIKQERATITTGRPLMIARLYVVCRRLGTEKEKTEDTRVNEKGGRKSRLRRL